MESHLMVFHCLLSYKPGQMRKEDLRLAAGLTTNMIANMGKGEHISMKTLLHICGALNCDITDVIALEQDASPTDIGPT